MAEENTEKKCPFAGLKGVIEWLSVVDAFTIKDHPNILPRWGFLMIVLAVLALF
jgi:ABC-type uncharacterized transport system permease subunit